MLTRLMKNTDLVLAYTGLAGYSTKEQGWPYTTFVPRVSLANAFPAKVPMLVNLALFCIPLVLFELLSLCWNLK